MHNIYLLPAHWVTACWDWCTRFAGMSNQRGKQGASVKICGGCSASGGTHKQLLTGSAVAPMMPPPQRTIFWSPPLQSTMWSLAAL